MPSKLENRQIHIRDFDSDIKRIEKFLLTMTTDLKNEELRFPMPWGHVAAKAWGFSKNKPVLVVHGLLDNAGSFDRLIAFLPHNYYYVCIDLPGHGFSTCFPEGIILDHFHYVSAIRRVIDHLKWEKYYYLGHSFGAILGLVYSALYPEEIEKLVSLDFDSPIPVANNELISYIRYIQDYTIKITEHEGSVRLYTFKQIMESLRHSIFRSLTLAAAEALIKRAVTKVGAKYKLNRDPRLNTAALAILNNEQHVAILKELRTPVLVIMSSQSAFVSNSPQSARIDPSKEKTYYVIVEGDHDVHNNSPERVAPHIWKFWGNLKSTL